MGKNCIKYFTFLLTGMLLCSWIHLFIVAANNQDPGASLSDESDTQFPPVDADTDSSDQFSDTSSVYSETESEYERQISGLQCSIAQRRVQVVGLAKDTEELIQKCNMVQRRPRATKSVKDNGESLPENDALTTKLQQLEKEVALDEQHFLRQRKRFTNYSIRQKKKAKVKSLAQSIPKGPKKKSRRK